ncbi:hypothetical protein VP455E521_P0093 [Vibrio phage 455E52-1]|nr:hypothetical protein VP455E521_P0093 [Vibrio phage 455E52-1]
METYIQVQFWLGILAFVLNVIVMAVKDFPYTQTKTIGNQLAGMIVSGVLTVWAAYLLFV